MNPGKALRAKLGPPQGPGCSLLSTLSPVELGGLYYCHFPLRVILEKKKQWMTVTMCGSREERGKQTVAERM